MADNVSITPGSGADIATDDVGGTQFQKVKVNLGGDGVDGSLWDGGVTLDSVTPDLMLGTDFSSVFGSSSVVSGTPALKVEEQGTVTVSSTNLDIRALTNSDVVTAELSATDNAVLDSIDSDLTTIAGAISGSEMQVDVVASLPSGDNNIGNIDVASISAGSNLIGDVGIQGRASGGLSTYYDSDLDETEQSVKGSAGTVYAIEAFNTTAEPLFLQAFNATTGNVTVGTTAPTMQWVIPGNADSDGAGFTFNVPQGVDFGTAITVACTTDSEGSSAPGAGACIVNIHYK